MAESNANDEPSAYVNPSEWYSDPELVVVFSEPEFDEKQAAELVKAWIVRQGRSWPAELDALSLTEKSGLVHVPYLVLRARVSFRWSGTGSETRTRRGSRRETRSRSLGTDGQGIPRYESYTVEVPTTETYTVTYPINGTVKETEIALDGSDAMDFSVQCGLPDLVGVAESATNIEGLDGDELLLLRPGCRTAEDVDFELIERLRAHLDSQGVKMVNHSGSVANFKVEDVTILEKLCWVHLYPIILSSYDYKDKEHYVQIDGHTRHVHVDVPWAVRVNRGLRRLAAVGVVLICVAGGWWLSARDDGARGGGSVTTESETGTEPTGIGAAPPTQQDERALGLDRPARRRIQSGLSAAGFDAGPADGQFGSRTRQAIGAWQAARGGAASGYLSASQAEELERLGTASGAGDAER